MSAAFDALSVARDLEAVGIEPAHAEAIAQAVHHGDERAATRADVEQLRRDLEASAVRLEARIYRASWMQGGALAALIFAAEVL